MDRFGSQGNRVPMVLCQRGLNQMKGRVFDLNLPDGSGSWTRPISQTRFNALLDQTMLNNLTAQNELFEELRTVIG